MLFHQQTGIARTNTIATHGRIFMLGLLAASLLMSASAFAVDPKDNTNADSETRYQHEKASCNNNRPGQDRATCLREAAAAYQEEKQGKLDSQPTATYRQNALARCQRLPVADQLDCRRRIDNPGDTEGSVESGGILRKDVTIIPAPAR